MYNGWRFGYAKIWQRKPDRDYDALPESSCTLSCHRYHIQKESYYRRWRKTYEDEEEQCIEDIFPSDSDSNDNLGRVSEAVTTSLDITEVIRDVRKIIKLFRKCSMNNDSLQAYVEQFT